MASNNQYPNENYIFSISSDVIEEHPSETKVDIIKALEVLHTLCNKISELETAEERLRQSEILSSILARLPDDYSNEIYILDTALLRLLHVNASACKALGYSMAELIGMSLLDICSNFNEEIFAVRATPLHAGIRNEVLFEAEYRRKDGTSYPVEVRLYLLQDETPPLYVVFARDITKLKHTQAALDASNEQLNILTKQYRLILHAAAEGICGLDKYGRFTFLNPAALRFLGWKAEELIGRSIYSTIYRPADNGFVSMHNESLSIERLNTGIMQSGDEAMFRRADGSRFFVEYTYAPIEFTPGEAVGGVITFRDITERKRSEEALRKAHDELEVRVAERTAALVKTNALLQEEIHVRTEAELILSETQRKLSTLMNNLPGIAYRRRADPEWTMEFASSGSYLMTGYRPAALIQNAEVSYASLIDPHDRRICWNAIQVAVEKHEPFEFYYRIKTADGEERWIWEQGCGVYTGNGELIALEGYCFDATERVLSYQKMERHVEERTLEIERKRQVAAGLYDILAILNSDSSLDSIIDYIVSKARKLLGADACVIWQLQSHQSKLQIQSADQLDSGFDKLVDMQVNAGVSGLAVLNNEPVVITDIRSIMDSHPALETSIEGRACLENGYLSVLAVPVGIKGQDDMYGVITLYYRGPRRITDEEIGLVVAFSHQTALVVENARLRAQLEENIISTTRSRLARELHDAVTQTLFSANLIANVLPQLWDRDVEEGRRRLKELSGLTHSALAEIRALLLELRPTGLTEVGLPVLLQHLAEAFSGRLQVPVTLTIEGSQRKLPSDIQIALYRIAQEALNNVVKHARARHSSIQLLYATDAVELCIHDDGRGFDPRRSEPAHLGVTIMRERAKDIGASLAIDSLPDQYTDIRVRWEAVDNWK